MRSFVTRASLLLLSGFLCGCSSTRTVWLEGVAADGRTAKDVRYALQSEDGSEGSITVLAAGYRDSGDSVRPTDQVVFQLVIDNASSDPITVPLDATTAFDDEQRGFARIESAFVRAPEGTPPERTYTVAPRERATLDLSFDLGAAGALRTTGSITLDWAYRFRGQETRHRTRFLPVRYVRAAPVYRVGYVHGYSYYGAGPWWYDPCW